MSDMSRHIARIILFTLILTCCFISINTTTAFAETYHAKNNTTVLNYYHQNASWTYAGTWTTAIMDNSYAQTVITGDTATLNPGINKIMRISTHMAAGTFGGNVGVNISLDGGNTWVLPSEITGVTRSDGVTGTGLNTINLYSATTAYPNIDYVFPESTDNNNIQIRLTRITGTLYFSYSEVFTRQIPKGWTFYGNKWQYISTLDTGYMYSYYGSGVYAIYNPGVEYPTTVYIRTAKGTSTGVIAVTLSTDEGLTWVLPSTINGITRSDGATGTGLDTISTYQSTLEYKPTVYHFPENQHKSIMFKYNVVTNYSYFSYGETYNKSLIIGMGNSITNGTYLTNTSYPTFLNNLMPEYTVLNRGISGQDSSQIHARNWDDALVYHPDYVIYEDGINDLKNRGWSVETVCANDKAMYDEALANGSTVIALTMNPLNNNVTVQAQINQVNEWRKSYAVGKNIIIADVYTALIDPSNPGNYLPAYVLADGIHPNYYGYEVMANTIYWTLHPPIANFSASSFSGINALKVDFTDNSTGTIDEWVWSFGDGSANVTSQNASHTFARSGTYTVILTVSNGGGSSSFAMDVTVNEPLSASFSSSPSSSIPLAMQFTDSSTGSPTSWAWSFGDSNMSTEQNPLHTYGASGTYNVTLTVDGESTISHIVSVSAPVSINNAYSAISDSVGDDYATIITFAILGLIVIMLFAAWYYQVIDVWQAVLFACIAIVAAMVIVLILSQIASVHIV